jgi:hypothetical protein
LSRSPGPTTPKELAATITPAAGTILALDLGKHKTVACTYDRSTAQARFDTSGETDRRDRITRREPALLGKLLVECAWVMLRYNGWARAVYQRFSQGKARKEQAVVALARKLLVRCWAMLRDRRPWRAEPAVPEAAPS